MRAVIAESYERIHRSNLVGMGILPLQFERGQNGESLGLDGRRDVRRRAASRRSSTSATARQRIEVRAKRADGTTFAFGAIVRIDTPQEVAYYQHGGILQYVLRQLLK